MKTFISQQVISQAAQPIKDSLRPSPKAIKAASQALKALRKAIQTGQAIFDEDSETLIDLLDEEEYQLENKIALCNAAFPYSC
jgi:outer membrane protein TolC